MKDERLPKPFALSVALLAVAIFVIFAFNVLLGGCAARSVDGEIGLVNEVTDQQGVAFTLYVGLADAETGTQKLTVEGAKELATPLVSVAGGGYTVFEAQGGFTNDAGELVENDTLVYTGIHADEQAVRKLIDDLKTTLNVESIYVTAAQEGYAIYGGTIAPAA